MGNYESIKESWKIQITGLSDWESCWFWYYSSVAVPNSPRPLRARKIPTATQTIIGMPNPAFLCIAARLGALWRLKKIIPAMSMACALLRTGLRAKSGRFSGMRAANPV